MTVALLGVPWDGSSSWRTGAASAPEALRRELERAREYANPFAESGLDVLARLRDAGDTAHGDATEMRAAVESAVGAVLAAGERPLVIGGDHSVTYPVLKAMRAAHGPVEVLHLDAHPDLYPEFGGDRFSHACPFARALEDGLVTRLVQVGLRSDSPPQRAMADRFGVEQTRMAEWGRPIGLFFEGPVYVSFDLDVLDPAFAPGVSHPEPGGLTVREALSVLQRVHGHVIGADLVEFNPSADHHGQTAIVMAKLVRELAGLLVS